MYICMGWPGGIAIGTGLIKPYGFQRSRTKTLSPACYLHKGARNRLVKHGAKMMKTRKAGG